MNSAAGHSCHLKEAPLFSSCRQCLRLTAEDGTYRAILSNQPVMHEPFHEGFRILKIRVFPHGTIQPEGPARCVRQSHVVSIPEICGPEQWHESAESEADGKPLAMRRTVRRRRFRLRSPHRERGLAVVSCNDDFPVTGGDRVKLAGPLTATSPNPFDERRV
jgi:hypothetical protein